VRARLKEKTARVAKGWGCCNRQVYHRCYSSSAWARPTVFTVPTSRIVGEKRDPDRRTTLNALTSYAHDHERLLARSRHRTPIKWLDQVPRAHPGQCAMRWITSSQKCPCNGRQARHGSHRLSRDSSPATSTGRDQKPGAGWRKRNWRLHRRAFTPVS